MPSKTKPKQWSWGEPEPINELMRKRRLISDARRARIEAEKEALREERRR